VKGYADTGLPDGLYLNEISQFGPLNGKFRHIWNILRPSDILYGHLVIQWQFGIFSPVFVYCDKKIWQPCAETHTAPVKNATGPGPLYVACGGKKIYKNLTLVAWSRILELWVVR
jgi:hypothetical protein